MIGIYPFKDYEGFKELFVREDGRRKNAVLLSCLKDAKYRAFLLDKGCPRGLTISNMGDLKDFIIRMMQRTRKTHYDGVRLMNDWFVSTAYYTDEHNGICEDRDYRAIRYVRREDSRVFKMKAGRFFRHLIGETYIGEVLPESAILWMCEEFQREWEAYSRRILPPIDEMELHVDDDFAKIYDGTNLYGNFHSCMTDEGHYPFYEEAVDAKAAYLTRADGMIMARCIIFTKVTDDNTGEIVRLAERQYSSECDDTLKHDLINALIKGGHIDGYKKIGAGCGESTAFVSISGESWSGRHFSIRCDRGVDDIISYQDSFKFMNVDDGIAYNYHTSDFDCRLDTTSMYLEGRNYDEYNNEYTFDEVTSVFANGRWMTCSDQLLDDDFYYIEGDGYIHEDYISHCPRCGEAFIDDTYHFPYADRAYSEITEEYYCCPSCRDFAEDEYKKENWTWSEYDGEYFEDEDDVTKFINEDGDEQSISWDSLRAMIATESVIQVGERYYHIDWAIEILERNI